MTTKLIFQEFSLLSLSSAEVSYCFIVIVLAYALRGGTGFGAAIAMPLLALVLPMKTLVPAWSVLSVVAGIDILRRDYDKIAWADLMPLMPGCLLGIVVGLAFYKLLDSPTLTRGLGLLVVLYGAFFIAGHDAAAARMANAAQIHRPAFGLDGRGDRHDVRCAHEPVLRHVF
jgi:uncharacterized membrane protein YfcA